MGVVGVIDFRGAFLWKEGGDFANPKNNDHHHHTPKTD
jgi:hypothetical protein